MYNRVECILFWPKHHVINTLDHTHHIEVVSTTFLLQKKSMLTMLFSSMGLREERTASGMPPILGILNSCTSFPLVLGCV